MNKTDKPQAKKVDRSTNRLSQLEFRALPLYIQLDFFEKYYFLSPEDFEETKMFKFSHQVFVDIYNREGITRLNSLDPNIRDRIIYGSEYFASESMLFLY